MITNDGATGWQQPDKIERTCNEWAAEGFEVFSVVCPQPSNYDRVSLDGEAYDGINAQDREEIPMMRITIVFVSGMLALTVTLSGMWLAAFCVQLAETGHFPQYHVIRVVR
jgi:hypothetical protein